MFNNGVAVIACHECDGNLSLMHHAESSSASRRHAFHAFQGSCLNLKGCLEDHWILLINFRMRCRYSAYYGTDPG